MSISTHLLGRYRLEEVLGHGGMALVYRAHDEELDRPVAIKLLADSLASDRPFRRRFLREARLAARLSHPNVVQVYDCGEADDRPYIAMEFVEGETLADLMERRRRLSASEGVGITRQVCAGLEHAHAADLVHRDIKPRNLLVRRDGTVKITDFGIARSEHGTKLTEIGSVLGTAAYLAPEQAAGEEVTAAADLYSLGVVLYELLAGRTPYVGDSLTQLLVRQQQQPVPPLGDLVRGVPAPVEDVVMRCLARDPERRPRSAAVLARELDAAVSRPSRPDLDSPPVATAEPATRKLTPPTRKLTTHAARPVPARALAWTVAGVALVVVLGGALAVFDRSDEPRPPAAPAAPRADSPGEQARDLSAWLRRHSR